MLTDRPFGSLVREDKPAKDLWGILDRHPKPLNPYAGHRWRCMTSAGAQGAPGGSGAEGSNVLDLGHSPELSYSN